MRAFLISGVIAGFAFTAVLTYALAIEFNRQAVVRAVHVKMGHPR